MKKTFTVNIGGQVFHIDEDAYNVLNDYLNSIRQHFSKTEGGDEICSDIEARISEMLRERTNDHKQVITLEDISEIIRIIGEPGEFGSDTFEEGQGSSQKASAGSSPKRLYRDPEHAMLGGVCSGLAAYFHTDMVWFRLGFVVAAIIGVGAPVLIYILLWIVVPEARTATERLEMKGEKVDLSNIGQSVREEIDKLKHKFNDFTREAKSTYKKKSEYYRPYAGQAGNALATVLAVFVRIILVAIGIILFITGLSLVIAFLALVFGFGHQIFVFDTELIFLPVPDLLNLITGGHPDSNTFIKAGLLLLLGIPILMILWGGVKLIAGIRQRSYTGIVFFYLWLIGLTICLYFGYKLSGDFRYAGNNNEIQQFEMPTDSIIAVRIPENEAFHNIERSGEVIEIENYRMLIGSSGGQLFYGIPELKIEKGSGNNPQLEIIRMAKGGSVSEADNRAGRIQYRYSFADSDLVLDPFFMLPEDDLWRVQQVILILRVPVGTYLKPDPGVRKIHEDDLYFHGDLSEKLWKMTNDGLIQAEMASK